MKRKHGFTLVELLVVIGIISLLISILLPSLARARDAATTVSCAANLRQIGQALMLYAESNKGKLPYAEIEGGSGADTWPEVITETLGGDISIVDADSLDQRLSPVLRDPGALVPPGTAHMWYRPNYVFHYVGHPRLIPPSRLDSPDPATGELPKARTLSSVNDSSSKALFWDAPQTTSPWMNNNAFMYSNPMDGWAWYGGHGFVDPPLDGSDRNAQMATGVANRTSAGDAAQNELNRRYNTDSEDNFNSFIRFRHSNQTTANVLFADGHVEGVQIGGIPRHMFLVQFR